MSNTSKFTHDLCIIGGGPGGYVAAIRAGQLKMKTVVVEQEHLGGVCLNWGCIPTKALLRSAEIYEYLLEADKFGISVPKGGEADIAKIVKRSRNASKKLNKGVEMLLKKNGVEVIMERGKISSSSADAVTVKAGKNTIVAKNVIVATGARARELPNLKPSERVWTAKEAMIPDFMPKKLGIIGSGAIGVEFASFYRSLGAEVEIFEILPQILPQEDREIATMAHKAFEKRGMKIHTGWKLTSANASAKGVTLKGSHGESAVDALIVAAGVVGNTEDLGLENTKVKVDRSIIEAGEFSRTADPRVFAIGDVSGPPMLAHKAEHEGVICVEAIANIKGHTLDLTRIPGCTYCHPQIASIGLTEEKAKAKGIKVKVGRFPFMGNGKAVALGDTQGMIKTLFDEKTGELLGAHMIGAEVTELIQGFVIAMTCEATEAELMSSVFPHPTLSEMMHESTLSAYGRAIHI